MLPSWERKATTTTISSYIIIEVRKLNRSTKWKRKEIDYTKITVKQISSFKDIVLTCDKIGLALDYIDEDYTSSDIYGLSISDGHENYYISFDDLKNDQKLLDILKDENIRQFPQSFHILSFKDLILKSTETHYCLCGCGKLLLRLYSLSVK